MRWRMITNRRKEIMINKQALLLTLLALLTIASHYRAIISTSTSTLTTVTATNDSEYSSIRMIYIMICIDMLDFSPLPLSLLQSIYPYKSITITITINIMNTLR